MTTLALALAARWPQSSQRVLVEADPAGGDLAARYQLPLAPGLVSLAVAARRSTDLSVLAAHAQQLPGGLQAIVGPTRGDQARAALSAICGADGHAGVLGSFAVRPDLVAIVDCGRLLDDPAVAAILRAADTTLLLARPRADELAHVAGHLDRLSSDGDGAGRIGLVLVGRGYPRGDVEREVGVPVVGEVPVAARAAAMLSGQRAGRPRTRSALIRAAAALAARLAAEIPRRPPGGSDARAPHPAAASMAGDWSGLAERRSSGNGHDVGPWGRP